MLISTPSQLEEVCAAAHRAGSIALDTEFVWERTYHPCLGLVQAALPDGSVFLLDAVALPQLNGLGKVLANPDITLILHDALQDLQILARHTSTLPVNVFDTRRAAGFAGLESTLSLAKLLQTFLQIDLAKDATRSNWLQRPLTESQAAYARDDVLHLHDLARVIKATAHTHGNTAALAEEMLRYNQPDQYQSITVDNLYRRINTTRYSHDACAVIFALLRWREQEAISRDRPRGHILKDQDLLQIAKNLTLQPPAHTNIPKRYASEIHAVIREAADLTPDTLPRQEAPVRLSNDIKKKIEARRAYIQKRATDQHIDPALVANKADITALVLHEHGLEANVPPQLVTGWRTAFTAPSSHSSPTDQLDLAL